MKRSYLSPETAKLMVLFKPTAALLVQPPTVGV